MWLISGNIALSILSAVIDVGARWRLSAGESPGVVAASHLTRYVHSHDTTLARRPFGAACFSCTLSTSTKLVYSFYEWTVNTCTVPLWKTACLGEVNDRFGTLLTYWWFLICALQKSAFCVCGLKMDGHYCTQGTAVRRNNSKETINVRSKVGLDKSKKKGSMVLWFRVETKRRGGRQMFPRILH